MHGKTKVGNKKDHKFLKNQVALFVLENYVAYRSLRT